MLEKFIEKIQSLKRMDAIVVYCNGINISFKSKNTDTNILFEEGAPIIKFLDWRFSFRLSKFYRFINNSVFLVYKLKENNQNKIISECMVDCQRLIDLSLEHHFLIRGGIAVGNVYFNHHSLSGEAVQRAISYEKLCLGPYIKIEPREYHKISKNQLFTGLDASSYFDSEYIILPSNSHFVIEEIKLTIDEIKRTNDTDKLTVWNSYLDRITKITKEKKNGLKEY